MNDVSALIEAELKSVGDATVVGSLKLLLVDPYRVMRNWDYAESQQYACWIVAEDRGTNTAIAYCDQGFGPTAPWGLLNLESEFNEMGPDSCWYSRLEDAFRGSPMWDGKNPADYEVQ